MKPESDETAMRTSPQSPHRPDRLSLPCADRLSRSRCLRPAAAAIRRTRSAAAAATPPALEKMTELDAWAAVPLMSPGINIGNTLDNTTTWETGWGNPPITKEFVESLAHLGFKTVRLPVAWDTYAVDGRIQPDKLEPGRRGRRLDHRRRHVLRSQHPLGRRLDRLGQEGEVPQDVRHLQPRSREEVPVVLGTDLDLLRGQEREARSSRRSTRRRTSATKARPQKAYATLTRVNQLFIDTVRKTGGNNAKRLLIVTGYSTDIKKTCDRAYALPKDTLPGRLFISVHYYTPYQFCGLTEDADWGKMMPTWGTPDDVKQLDQLFDMMKGFCTRNDIPAFIGEFGVTTKKESASRIRWMSAVVNAVDVEANGSGALGHRDRGLPPRAVRRQPRSRSRR